MTGVQRYASELLKRDLCNARTVAPKAVLHGARGHLWEQIALPVHINKDLLFSPSNTGPLSVTRQVVTIHDLAPIEHPEWFSPKFALWYRYLIPRLAHRALRVIAVSEFTRCRLLDRFKLADDKVVTIRNGVDANILCAIPLDQGEVLVDRLPYGVRYLLSVGSVEPRKNYSRLIKAWGIIVDTLPEDLWLVIAGVQRNHRVFSNQTELGELPPRVHFTGHVSNADLDLLYTGALAFVYPSLYEGFGLPLLEAMSHGIPVLSSNAGALAEVAGKAAVLVDPHDVEALAHSIQSLVYDERLRQELRERGLRHVALFSWDETARRTARVLEEGLEAIR